jgi:hypothetical protein
MNTIKKVSGFDTLEIKERNGKFYIFDLFIKRTIGPEFDSVEELERYADKTYTGEYC